MIRIPNVSRYRAAAYHLGISAGIAGLVLALMLVLWYPPPLFGAMGGTELAMLIVGVDVCIGPLITLIVFDTRKKSLPFDLAVVAALQLAALSYGCYAMYWGRPVFTVFTGEYIAVVAAAQIEPKHLAEGPRDEFRRLSLTGPLLVATEPPTDPEGKNELVFATIGDMGIQNRPKYFAPYADKRAEVLKASRPLADLDLDGQDRERLEAYLNGAGRKPEDLRCLPVKTKRGLLTAVIDAGSGDLLKILDLKPSLKVGR